MRILITTDAVGGVWSFTQELTSGLLEQGVNVGLICLGGGLPSSRQQEIQRLLDKAGQSFRFENCGAPLEWAQQNDRAYSDATALMLQMIAEFRPDVLHLNEYCLGALPVDVPKVVTAHSDVLSWADACRREPLEETEWLRRYLELVAGGLNGATTVVAPTAWMLQALGKNFRFACPSRVIFNGRKQPHTSARKRHLRGITAGRLWDEAKGVSLLDSINAPFPLRVAGDTGGLTDAAQGGTSVEYLGSLSEAELFEEFSGSAIYICTSVYEPFGLAPLEAALCGCAIVARDIPSLREVWDDGATFFSDEDSLSKILHVLYRSPDNLSELQRRSLLRARTFTTDKMVQGYLAAYAEAMARTGACEHAA